MQFISLVYFITSLFTIEITSGWRKFHPFWGLRRNNFAELAPGFGSDLAVPIEQNHRNSNTISRILRLTRNQRWPEAGMRKCEVIFAQALSSISTLLIGFVVVTSASAGPMFVAYTPVLLQWILTTAYSKVL